MKEVLKRGRYKKIRFKLSKTNHLFVKAKINEVVGDFIIDTGASNSCIDFEHIGYFSITPQHSPTKASGAGANGMHTQVSYHNELKMGRWSNNSFDLVILDLTHVNTALIEYKVNTVHGIIGSDVLLKGNAIIDYREQVLYLE